MKWSIEFLPEAQQDMDGLDNSVRTIVLKGILKVSNNPLPTSQGGYGKPLGNKSGLNLTNLLKITFHDVGIRAVYKVIYDKNIMKIIVVSARKELQVYKEAAKRRRDNGL